MTQLPRLLQLVAAWLLPVAGIVIAGEGIAAATDTDATAAADADTATATARILAGGEGEVAQHAYSDGWRRVTTVANGRAWMVRYGDAEDGDTGGDSVMMTIGIAGAASRMRAAGRCGSQEQMVRRVAGETRSSVVPGLT